MRLVVSLAFLAFTLAASPALARIRLCLEVRADASDQKGFEKLVRAEIGRHDSHEAVEQDCDSMLTAESFAVGRARYLTLRIGQEIPVRYTIADDAELLLRLAEGLTLVLGNDPSYLAEDISRLSSIQRVSASIFKRGQNIFRLELFQATSRTDQGPVFVPGAAAAATRGADHWLVQARLYLGGWPTSMPQRGRALRVYSGIEAGIFYEASAKSSTSFYFGGGAGGQFLRFEGLVDDGGEEILDHVNQLLFTVNGRFGVRFLRLYDFDCDIFVAGYLPLFATNQTDALLFGEKGIWTPSAQVGLGIGF